MPLSSKTDKLYPCEARGTVEGKESKAMADQIMTVTKERLTERLGCFPRTNYTAWTSQFAFNLDSRRDGAV